MKKAIILHELRSHAPFTALGTLGGILLLAGLSWGKMPLATTERFFAILHPLHVLLSGHATIATFRRAGGHGFWRILAIGYLGAVGIGTLSDCLIPYLGEWLMGLPQGWVTDPQHSELTNSQQITVLGNGVLPLQAATAIDSLRLLPR